MLLEFDQSGDCIYSVCKDNNVSVSDTETGKMKVYFEKAHREGLEINSIILLDKVSRFFFNFRGFVTSLCLIDDNTFATGDEDGLVNGMIMGRNYWYIVFHLLLFCF